MKARVLLITDHPIGCIGLESCLRELPGVALCEAVQTVRQALLEIPRLKPKLLIVDVCSPSENHLNHIRDLHGLFPVIPILTFSNQAGALYAERALRLGAKGYVTEHCGVERLKFSVKRLLEGHVCLPEAVAETMLLGMASAKNASRSPMHLLSERKLQVFEMIGEGRSIADVSAELGISRKTVGTHRSHIRQKLGARTAYDLLEFAFRWVQVQKS
jgi:DNA-binding NarL/FixJ family response regulator